MIRTYSLQYILKFASHTQETKKVCSRAPLLKNNQVWQFLKFMISNASHMHIGDLSRPATTITKKQFTKATQRIL